MSDSSWLSIFFRLANFALLAAVGYYAYRKYLKGPLEEKVNQQEAVLKGLEEQGYFLEGRAEDLAEQHQQQERHIELLMQKVNEWNDAVIGERHKAQDENRIFATRTAERVTIKNTYFAQHELQMKIAPLVIQDAKQALQKKFSDPDLRAQYAHDVVRILKRKRET
jgi:hypothetical protein